MNKHPFEFTSRIQVAGSRWIHRDGHGSLDRKISRNIGPGLPPIARLEYSLIGNRGMEQILILLIDHDGTQHSRRQVRAGIGPKLASIRGFKYFIDGPRVNHRRIVRRNRERKNKRNAETSVTLLPV